MVDATMELLAAHGAMLAGGVTGLMLAGTVVAILARQRAVLRQRGCELGVLAALGWLLLACLPLPRVGWEIGQLDRGVGAVVVPMPVPKVPSVSDLEIPAELIAKPQAAHAAIHREGALSPGEPIAVIASQKEYDMRPLIARVFLAGAAGCAGWLVLGQALLWRLIRRSVGAPEAVFRMVDARLRTGRRRPVVRVAPGLSRPVTCGVWRPTILLPPALLEEGCERQLRQVVLHELGHVQQRDGWGNLLFCLALPVLYFHPLYWWLRRSASLARELVADDWAARADGKEAYVTELVAMARTRMAGVAGPIGAIGILQNRSHFYRRMRMLLQRQDQLATRCSNGCRAALATLTVIAVMGMAAIVGVRPARGQTAPPAAPPAAGEVAGDRTIGPQDFLEITMTDVAGAGVKSLAKARVDEKGNVVLPVVGSVKAVGLTREELEKAIAQNYRDKNLIQNSTVSVKFIEKGAATANAIELFTDAEISKMDPVMKQKKAERDAIAARIVALRAEGTGDDGPELAKARAELAVAERALREMRDVQAKTQEDSARRPGAAVRTAIDELTPRQISMVDPVMKKLQAERDAIMDRVVQLRAKGLGDDHPDMAKAEAELAMAERKMEVYAHDWRDMQKRLAQDEAPRPGAAVPIPLLPAPGAQAPPVAAAVGGVQLDLVNLANTLVDAAGAVRVAKVNLDARKRMADAGGGSDVQLATAESNLQTAAKRLELLKGIASIALETARTDAKRAEQLYKQGAESEQAFSEAMSKMKMLELIVKGVD